MNENNNEFVGADYGNQSSVTSDGSHLNGKEQNGKAKSKAINHEYYMHPETARNRLFDTYTGKQNEDFHLDLAHPNGIQGESENEHIIHNKKRGVSNGETGNKESFKQ